MFTNLSAWVMAGIILGLAGGIGLVVGTLLGVGWLVALGWVGLVWAVLSVLISLRE